MRNKAREAAYAAIDSERAYQVSRAEEVSGPGTGEHTHSVEEFVLYMDDYMHDLKHQLSRVWTPNGKTEEDHPAMHTLRKVVALGVAAMEQHGAPRREGF